MVHDCPFIGPSVLIAQGFVLGQQPGFHPSRRRYAPPQDEV
jgi:hypothetical protein